MRSDRVGLLVTAVIVVLLAGPRWRSTPDPGTQEAAEAECQSTNGVPHQGLHGMSQPGGVPPTPVSAPISPALHRAGDRVKGYRRENAGSVLDPRPTSSTGIGPNAGVAGRHR